jgi:hypothetical protein
MVRERLGQYWIDHMYSIFENEPELTDKEVAERLKNMEEELGKDDYPAPRTVNKYRRMYEPKSLREKAAYKLFAWPEEMGSDLLPWEASQAALELLGILFSPEYTTYPEYMRRYLRKVGEFDFPPYGRPTILLVHWFWRVTMAAPDMPARIQDNEILDYQEDGVVKPLAPENWPKHHWGGHAMRVGGPDRFTAAQQLTSWEIMGKPPSKKVRELEAYLAWQAAPAHLKASMKEPAFPLGVDLRGLDVMKAVAVVATLRGARAANEYNALRRAYPEIFNKSIKQENADG